MSTEFYDQCELKSAPWSPGPKFAYGLSELEPAVQTMKHFAESTGLPFLCVEAESGTVLARSEEDFVELLPWMVQSQLSGISNVRIIELNSGLVFYALPLPGIDGSQAVAVGYVLNRPESCPVEMQVLADEFGWDETDVERWMKKQRFCQPQLLERLLVNLLDSDGRRTELESDVDRLVDRVERTFEEINVLHHLTASLQLSRSPLDLAEMCLNSVYELIGAQGNLVVIDEWKGRRHLLIKGNVPLDDDGFQRLLQRFSGYDWTHPLVRFDLDGTLLGADFPGLHNFVIAQITDGAHTSGWLFLCNLPQDRPVGAVQTSLLKSVATIMATHHQNQELYHKHEDLLLQFVSSLVSTLDAKDPYTRGHSERVAQIARRLGQEIGLPPEDLDDIYQAGLLHDIGKIGVNDSVLQKDGPLTEEEFEHVKEHPMIGYRILSGLTSLQKILPGVRNHHEDYSGGGYPDGLAGEEIPMLARILAVADAYDAMRSDRPYRKGLPLEKVEEIFRCGSGQQWDARIIDAYFRARDDVKGIGDAGVTGKED